MAVDLCRSQWLVLCVLLGLLSSSAVALQVVDVTRVSISSAGAQGTLGSSSPSISADGRYLAFTSTAENLVPGDTNGWYDVFVRDLVAGTTERVSVSSGGEQGNHGSGGPSISADGRYVAFTSQANNLVPADTNAWVSDSFVHDRQTGATTRVSVSTTGQQGNGRTMDSTISADGRFVAFESLSDNLVADDTNEGSDIFVHDRQSGQTIRVSVLNTDEEAHDRSGHACISGDGRHIAFHWFPGGPLPDGGGQGVFVYNRLTGETSRVSVSSDGQPGNNGGSSPCISGDGRYVVFESKSTNLVPDDTNGAEDVFVHDRRSGATIRVTDAEHESQRMHHASISPAGRVAAFTAEAANLVPDDTNGLPDTFVYDREADSVIRVNLSAAGEQADRHPGAGTAVSADGQYVAFCSYATNLVPGDTNGHADVFVARLERGTAPRTLWLGADGYAIDGVEPSRGDADGSNFTFRVKVTDLDGGPLTTRRAAIQQLSCGGPWVPHEKLRLAKVAGTLGRGAVYEAQTALPNGVYRYRFTVEDADGPATGPPTAWTQGPRRVGTPFLCWSQKSGYKTDGVNPNRGPVGTTFIFKVMYMDGAGDAPTRKRLLIRRNGGLWRSFEMRGVAGGDRRLGKLYRRDVVVDKPGQYAYRFDFRDGTGPATGEPTEWRKIGSVTDGGASGAQVTGMSAIPTPAGAQVVFSLSAAAEVQARVLNLAGRPVKTLCSARACEAGTNTLLWNAMSDRGTAAPNGTYLVEVTVRSEDGAEARALAQVRVQR